MKYFVQVTLFVILLSVFSDANAQKKVIPAEVTFGKDGDVSVFKAKISPDLVKSAGTWLKAVSSNNEVFFVCVRPEIEAITSSSYDYNSSEWSKYYEEIGNLNTLISETEKIITKEEARIETLKSLESSSPQLHQKIESLIVISSNSLESNRKKVATLKEKVTQVQSNPPKNNYSSEKKNPNLGVEVFGRFRSGVTSTEISLIPVYQIEDKSPQLTISVTLPSSLPPNKELVKEWANAWIYSLATEAFSGGEISFHLYEIRKIAQQFDIPIPEILNRFRDFENRHYYGSDGSDINLFSITTGGLAVEESLQSNNSIILDSNKPVGENISISSLEEPQIKSHPFDKMLAGKTPILFDIARLIPQDQYYVHFSTLSAEIALSDLLDQWGTNLLQSIEISSRNTRTKERILDQLGIELSTLTRLFGDIVVDDLAITGSDLFFEDGSDVSVIFQVKNAAIFDRAMAMHRAEMLKKRSDAQTSVIKYNGIEINSFKTNDREISSYWTTIDSYKIYSNSLSAIQRILDTSSGKIHSLKNSTDFQYMRTIFPGTNKDEDGFVYFSDAFVRRVVGAEQKIARLRQLQCIAHLKTFRNARFHQMIENGKSFEVSISSLIKSNLLNKSEQVCPSGGIYTFNSFNEPICSIHGSLPYLTPIIEIPTKYASSSEAEGYKKFVGEYNQFWSKFFDPIGIRFNVREKIEVETCILPLVENSIYNNIKNMVGGEPSTFESIHSPSTIASIFFNINKENLLKEFSNDQIWGFREDDKRKLLDSMGSTITLNLCDGSPLFTAGERLSREFISSRSKENLIITSIFSGMTLPIYQTVALKDTQKFRTAFRKLMLSFVAETRMRKNTNDIGIEEYSIDSYRGHDIDVIKYNLYVIDLRFYSIIIKNKFIFATQLEVLKDLIDKAESGTLDTTSQKGNLAFKILPEQFHRISQTLSISWQEKMRSACLNNTVGSQFQLATIGVDPITLGSNSYKYFGYIPVCPSGGNYIFDKDSNSFRCSIHGSINDSKQPLVPSDKDKITQFVNSIKLLDVGLSFTPEGIRTKIIIEKKH